jgi:hypothetical protein
VSKFRLSRTFDDAGLSVPAIFENHLSFSSDGVKYALTKQVEVCATVHHSLNHLQAVHLTFDLSIAPLVSEGGFDSSQIATQARDETTHLC